MNKRISILIVSIILFVALFFTVSFAFTDIGRIIKGEYSVYDLGKGKILVPRLSQEEKKTIVENNSERLNFDETTALESISDNKTVKYDKEKNETLPVEQAEVKINYEEGTLKLIRINKDNLVRYVPQKGENVPVLNPSENSDKYVFSGKNKDIYLLNAKDDSISKISKDKIDNFDKADIMSHIRSDGNTLIWADRPRINSKGTLVAYSTTRRGFTDDSQYNADMWMIDLESGKEFLLLENARPIQWVDDTLIYQTLDFGMYSMNYPAKTSKCIIEKAGLFRSLEDYIIFRESPENMDYYLYNIKKSNTKIISVNGKGNISFDHKISPDNKNIVATFFKDGTDINSACLVVINVDTNDKKFLKLPEGIESHGIEGWADNENIVITIYKNNGSYTETALINVNDIVNVENDGITINDQEVE